ncbi:MAG: tetratricopeptide repeat protein [Proteobacteria bacterium]|nr:tetratricopeptide repeat protein [Pseudomonadota bacterium]MBU1737973.1 tetratricopeptide repeat protein [Pseudomonadota bacterium]
MKPNKLAKKLRKQRQKTAFMPVNTLSFQLYSAGKTAEAANASLRELQADPKNPTALFVRGQLLRDQGQDQEAIELFSRALAAKPNFAEALFALGCTYTRMGRNREAIPCFKKIVTLGIESPLLFNVMGNAHKDCGEIDTAINCYKKGLHLDPDFYQAHFNLGNAFHADGKIQESIACFKKALSINNEYYLALDNLGTIYDDLGNYEEAVSCYNRSIRINSANPVAHNNLANVLRNGGLLEEAEKSCLKALDLNSNFPAAYKNLGTICHEMGRETEAVAGYRKSLALAPDHRTHSNLLSSLNYLEDVSQEEIYSESLRWDALYAPESTVAGQGAAPHFAGGRRLKIGYVSPDFCDHSVSYFIDPVLHSHHREHFEVYCYANVKKPDAITSRLRDAADHWRDIFGMNDPAVVSLIKKDGIDILVDLAGHTRDNRLLVFAGIPAPVRITWLGYPNTTGMKALQYRLTDGVADPPGDADRFHSEKLLRLPQGFLCYQPDPAAPEVSPAPCLEKGGITFGSFNNLAKVTDRVIRLWAEILLAVPGSRLLLKSRALGDRKSRKRYLALFGEAGITEDRLELLGMLPDKADHLGLYRNIDIALDPFPYNGTTTTFEALWMGVPVVTLRGERHAGRVGASIMHHAGLEKLVAESTQEYKTLAIALAEDRTRLAELRNSLREKLQQSPLLDGQRFTESLEECYRKAVAEYC